MQALSSAKDRFKLYMGHLHRAVNQDGVSQKKWSVYAVVRPGNVLIIIDYKMKFEPIMFRETRHVLA